MSNTTGLKRAASEDTVALECKHAKCEEQFYNKGKELKVIEFDGSNLRRTGKSEVVKEEDNDILFYYSSVGEDGELIITTVVFRDIDPESQFFSDDIDAGGMYHLFDEAGSDFGTGGYIEARKENAEYIIQRSADYKSEGEDSDDESDGED